MVKSATSTGQKRIWQYAFVIGMASCIVAAILVFGLSSFTTTLTIAGIIIGVFNAFLGSSQDSKDGNWFLSRIKHSLDVSGFLKVATIVVWLTTISLTTYGVLQSRREAQKVTLAGRVLTAGGDPAGNAQVALLTRNKRDAVTSPDGSFTFSRIDLGEEPSKQVKIQIIWKNKTAEETVDLTTLTSSPLIIKLPAGDPPFRVSYITLEGPAIDLFLRGQIDSGWDKRLGGKPYIVSNSVFQTLQQLSKNYSVPTSVGEDDRFTIETNSTAKEDQRLKAKLNGKPSFVGSEGGSVMGGLSESDLLSVFDSRQQWTLGISPLEPDNVLDTLYFWRFARREDLEKFWLKDSGVNPRNKFVDFYKYISRSSMPEDFCLLDISIEGGCEGGDPRAELSLVPRKLKLRVAVLENITSERIQIGKFILREFKEENLRSRDEEDTTLKALNPEPQELFPLKGLAPNEKLVIPLEMPMTYDREANYAVESLLTPPNGNKRQSVTRKLSSTEKFTVHFGEPDQRLDLETARLLEMLNGAKGNPLLDKEYVFGPAVSVESVYVDNVNFPFRQQDVSRVVIRGGSEIGSCPFVYTYSAETGSWQNEGHILYGRNGSLKESTDEKQLERFDGRVLIKEDDPEVSFIDFVYIKATSLDGTEKLLYPLNKALRFQDRDYLRMRQGEQLEVKFDVPLNLPAGSYTLVARGYYAPFNRPRPNNESYGRSQRK